MASDRRRLRRSRRRCVTLLAYRKLVASGFLKPSDRVVLFNTGSGLKYTDVMAKYLERGAEAGSTGSRR